MKKFLFTLVAGIVLTGCVKEIPAEQQEEKKLPETASVREISGIVIPIEDALAEMYSLMGELYGLTRSSSVAPVSIETLEREVVIANGATRSSSVAGVAYLVNFGEENGFAVLGAIPEVPSVVAITEKGTISVEDFNTTYTGNLTAEQLWCEEDQEYYLGSSNIRLPIALIGQALEETEHVCGALQYGPWLADSTELYTDALLQTKWFQSPPFNNKAPKDSKSEATNGRSYAGCVPIAVAQILAHNAKDSAADMFEVESTWEELIAYNYSDFDRDTTAFGARIHEDIATILKKIGDDCGARYAYWCTDNTFATPYKAKNYFKDHANYSNLKKYESYKEGEIIKSLKNGKPVFIGALSSKWTGHAWVIDGYMKQTRTITNNCGHTSKTNTRKLVHCNFGWGGNADGYYVTKSSNMEFNTISGPADTEPIDEIGNDTGSRKYTWWFRTVVYDL